MDPKRETNPSDDLEVGGDPVDDEFLIDLVEADLDDETLEDELLEELGL